MERPAPGRVAFFSLHSSPLDQPGTGDSGGMNVYIRTVGRHLAAMGLEIDVFTRCAGRGVPEVEEPAPGFRVIQVQAGPCAPVAKGALDDLVPSFADAVLDRGGRYDVVHAHYWLSGWAARHAARRWQVPLVATFHTLARVKDLALVHHPEPPGRVAGERRVIAEADRILAATPSEAGHLHRLYDAPPGRIRVVPPGVDTDLFRPLEGARIRSRLGLAGRRVVLFVGRFQALKGPDLAVRAVAEAVRRAPGEDIALLMVGGPSGEHGAHRELRALAESEGIGERVVFHPPVPHEELPAIYSAADVVLVPSRSESFGLVALEAQACGVPVVASATGGLRYVVDEGGYVVRGNDPAAYAGPLLRVLADSEEAARLSEAAVRRAAQYPWEATAAGILSVYAELGLARHATGASA